jgi:hypothetical protein
VLGILAVWAARWLPRLAEQVLARHDESMRSFQAELASERKICQERFDLQAEILRRVEERQGSSAERLREIDERSERTLEAIRETLAVVRARRGG